jgi:predicted cobalt transporter CbtA
MDEAKAKADEAKGIHHEVEPELVSRHVQAGLGLLTGVTVYCTAFGGLFALVFSVANGRIGKLSPRTVSALLAAEGFVAVYIVPNLKYPANPPSVGEPETIGFRTACYFIMMAASIAAMVGATMLRERLAEKFKEWNAFLIAAGCYITVVVIVQFLLPGINEVPDEFPAVVLWRFRVASLFMQLVMWATIGLLFGFLTERAALIARRPSSDRRQSSDFSARA